MKTRVFFVCLALAGCDDAGDYQESLEQEIQDIQFECRVTRIDGGGNPVFGCYWVDSVLDQ